jgi:hypothetical protein
MTAVINPNTFLIEKDCFFCKVVEEREDAIFLKFHIVNDENPIAAWFPKSILEIGGKNDNNMCLVLFPIAFLKKKYAETLNNESAFRREDIMKNVFHKYN